MRPAIRYVALLVTVCAVQVTTSENAIARQDGDREATTNAAEAATPQQAAAFFQQQEWDAAASAYEYLTRTSPETGGFWYRLGASRHQLGNYREALAAYAHAEKLGVAPAATAYNMACAHALLGETEEALARLETAVENGFQQFATMRSDADLESLRADDRFVELLTRVEAAAYPCRADANHHKLDFWIGKWDVYVNGSLAGHNDIESVAAGCALTESWVNTSGIPGVSLNYYDATIGKYKQIWVASGSHTEFIETEAGEGKLILVATQTDADGNETRTRLSFTRQGDNVRQLFETSSDGGTTWTSGFDGLYVPRPEQPVTDG